MKMIVEINYDIEDETKEEAYARVFNALDDAGYNNEFSFKVIEKPVQVIEPYKYDKCPFCGNGLMGTYKINCKAKSNEDAKVYGLVCINCASEFYD